MPGPLVQIIHNPAQNLYLIFLLPTFEIEKVNKWISISENITVHSVTSRLK